MPRTNQGRSSRKPGGPITTPGWGLPSKALLKAAVLEKRRPGHHTRPRQKCPQGLRVPRRSPCREHYFTPSQSAQAGCYRRCSAQLPPWRSPLASCRHDDMSKGHGGFEQPVKLPRVVNDCRRTGRQRKIHASFVDGLARGAPVERADHKLCCGVSQQHALRAAWMPAPTTVPSAAYASRNCVPRDSLTCTPARATSFSDCHWSLVRPHWRPRSGSTPPRVHTPLPGPL